MALPTGTVTFLFTDIEGSTRRWDEDREGMRKALQRHDAVLRGAIESNAGTVLKTVGDAFYAVFHRTEDALAATLAVQQGLRAAGDGLRVRAATHTGTADERDGDYFGPAVNRVARLLSAGHGGQILLSQAAADLAKDVLPHGCSLIDLGSHRLKDLQRPERVFQLAGKELERDFPPLRSVGGAPTNLPAGLGTFVGRETQIAAIAGLLKRYRIVTLTGSGGVGKTSTALQVARARTREFQDGVWLVELAPLEDEVLIVSTIAQTLKVRIGEDADTSLAAALAWLNALIVLDNCEHLINEAARVVSMLAARCPGLRFLITSRQPLQIEGETSYRIPSLGSNESMELFSLRARTADGRFEISDANRAIVSDICARLDGIPLAIELAAARIKVLDPQQLRRRLNERFRLLVGNRRDTVPRQQTLRAVIDWSYDLLDPRERVLFCRLAIFAGGWQLEAAERVCAFDGLETLDILDLHASLVDKSLVSADVGETATRYKLLESNRSYALEKLFARDEYETVAKRHAEWIVEYVPRIGEKLFAEGAAYDPGLVDNVRSALAWASGDGGTVEIAARLAAAAMWIWKAVGFSNEGLRWIEMALRNPPQDAELHAKLLLAQSVLAIGALHIEAAQKAVDLLEERGESRTLAWAYSCLATGFLDAQRTEEARAAAERSRSLYAESAGTQSEAYAGAISTLATIASDQGAYGEARDLYREALAIRSRFATTPLAVTVDSLNLADMEFNAGNHAEALQLIGDVAETCERAELHSMHAIALCNEAGYRLLCGDFDPAHAAALRSLDILLRYPYGIGDALAISHLATIAAARGGVEGAAQLLGYADARCAAVGYERIPAEQRCREVAISALRSRLTEAELSQALAAGAGLSDVRAAELARVGMRAGGGETAADAAGQIHESVAPIETAL